MIGSATKYYFRPIIVDEGKLLTAFNMSMVT